MLTVTPYAIFTGDTLFVGDVGRPDLSSGNLTQEELASMLFDSLKKKISPLPDEVIIYPAHGAGSSCGKNIGPDTYSTLGEERKSNYALLRESKEEFIKAVTDGLNTPPQYFAVNARINKEGYESLDGVMENGLKPLNIEEFKTLIKDDDTIMSRYPPFNRILRKDMCPAPSALASMDDLQNGQEVFFPSINHLYS